MTSIVGHLLLVTTPLVYGARLGTAQDETFAILLGSFMALSVLILFWLRSGHERARRTVLCQRQREEEHVRERARILEAHSLPPRPEEDLPR